VVNGYVFKICEHKDIDGNFKGFVCAVTKDGIVYGNVFEAATHEAVFAWLRLVMGEYPGTADFVDRDVA
jgi:hypothetical protein